MAKIYPCTAPSPSPSAANFSTQRQTYTIWMKSLVLNSNGCTVFDSNGVIVYRVDNYDKKCSSEVCLMDLRGNVLCTILRKGYGILGSWEGYKGCDCEVKNAHSWFKVQKNCKILTGNSDCKITVKRVERDEQPTHCSYRIKGVPRKSTLKITDSEGRTTAEVKQKQSASGVALGNDVLSLVLEPHSDFTLVMSLVTVLGLIHNKM